MRCLIKFQNVIPQPTQKLNMKPLSYIITIMLLLLNSIVSLGQDTRILSRWREEAIVKDLLKGDQYKILVDSLSADTADLRHQIKLHEGVEIKLNHALNAKEDEILYWVKADGILKKDVAKQKRRTRLWMIVAGAELLLFLWIR